MMQSLITVKNVSMMKKSKLLPFLLVIGLMFWSGCDEEVSPFVEEDRYFSVYGYLDTSVNEQALRVIELRTEFATGVEKSIDALVSTTETETGVTTVWRDSSVTFTDGSVGHIYVANFRPVPGLHYELNVTRSDGKRATATTHIPTLESVQVSDPIPGFVGITQKVLWPQVDFIPFRVQVWYRTLDTATEGLPFREAVVNYGDDSGRVGRQTANGWEIVVRYAEDKKEVGKQLGFGEGDQPILLSMGMRLTMTDDNWRPPDGFFNPEILVQPGTFSNVEGGFGFFGSLNQFALEWTLSPEATQTAGYTNPGKR